MTSSQVSIPIHRAGAVFIDRWHAMVARSDDPWSTVTDVDRSSETEAAFVRRVARETSDCERIVIMGPGDARLAFEREYVALYQRPDRLVDDEAATSATRSDLLDRLRILGG